ncbi:MAG: stage III sporulation protein AE [Muricoprocola sp.]
MKGKKWGIILSSVFFWYLFAGGSICAYEEEQQEILNSYLEELGLEEIQESLEELLPEINFNLREAIQKLLKGEMPITKDTFLDIIRNGMTEGLQKQKKFVIQILILAIAASIFTNYVQVFQREQIIQVTFYMVYMLLFLLLIHSFEELGNLAEETMGGILQFMRLLIPVYLIVGSLAAGSVTATGFYGITLFFITLVQSVMNYVILPGISLYVLFALLNYMEKEPFLTKMTDLMKWILNWAMKTLLAIVIGIQAIQSMLLPAIDSLKNTVWMKGTGAIPVLGNTLSAVTETVLGTVVLLKNALGVGALLVILLICLTPVIRLFLCVILYKAISAVVQPISDVRFTESISKTGEGIELLLKSVSFTAVMFMITLAMVTVSGRN